MTSIKQSKIFVPISVKDELPEIEKEVTFIASQFGKREREEYCQGWLEPDGSCITRGENGKLSNFNNNPDLYVITHWLKEQSLYTLRREEMEELLGRAFDAGETRGQDYVPGWGYDSETNAKEVFIQTIINK